MTEHVAASMAALNERFFGRPELPFADVRPSDAKPLGTNEATPLELTKLLVELDELTDQLIESDRKRWVLKECKLPPISPIPCPQLMSDRYMRGELRDQTTDELNRWRARLDYYLALANEADPLNREAVLYEVTAPVLLGWHFADTIPEDVLWDGYPDSVFRDGEPGPWFELQHVPDAMTPIILADVLGEDLEFERDNDLTKSIEAAAANWAGDIADVLGNMAKGAESFAKDAALVAGVGALVVVGLVLALKN